MPSFGSTSSARLNTCDERLIRLFERVVETYDCSIIEGHRSRETHESYMARGVTRVPYERTKHRHAPSLAVDVAPYPIDWNDTKRFYHFAGFVQAHAEALGIPIRWGGDWDQDYDLNDQTFNDLVHFETTEESI